MRRTGISVWCRHVAAAAALAACAWPQAAVAKSHPGSPDSTFSRVYLDADRCTVLADQVGSEGDRFAGEPLAAAVARGLALCRNGRFAEGADALALAVRRAGLTPARPRPFVRLR